MPAVRHTHLAIVLPDVLVALGPAVLGRLLKLLCPCSALRRNRLCLQRASLLQRQAACEALLLLLVKSGSLHDAEVLLYSPWTIQNISKGLRTVEQSSCLPENQKSGEDSY